MLERRDQPVVVALVQADRRLVEHVHHAREAGADLRREADPLRLAARQRLGAALERQVVEADVVQEGQPRDDFLDHLVGDLALRAFERQAFEVAERIAQRPAAHFIDRACAIARADPHEARLAAQARAVARRAWLVVLVLRQFLAHRGGIGFAVAAFQVRDDPFEHMFANRRAAALVDVGERDRLLAGTVQQHLLDLLGQILERGVDVEIVVRREALQHLEVELVAPVPPLHRARGERQRRMRDNPLRIEERDLAEAVAFRARAHRVVEREQSRLEFLQRVRAHRARELRAEQVFLVRVHLERDRAAVGQAQRGLERLGEALLHVRAHFQAVDDDVDRVLLVLLELRQRIDLVDLSDAFVRGAAARAHAEAHEALRLHVLEQLDVLALAVRDDGREDHQLRILRQRERRVDHLRHALRFERDLVVRAVRRADTCVQKSQVVVDFGDRADGRARVVRRRLLLDRDRGRKPLDQVDVRFLHQLQELTGIGRQALDVAALALGIERVECERRFARSGQPGNHDQFVPRQVEIDVLQVVGSRPTDTDLFHEPGKKVETKPATIAAFRDRRSVLPAFAAAAGKVAAAPREAPCRAGSGAPGSVPMQPAGGPAAPVPQGRIDDPDLSPPAAGRTFRSFEIHSRCPIRLPRPLA